MGENDLEGKDSQEVIFILLAFPWDLKGKWLKRVSKEVGKWKKEGEFWVEL